MLIIGMERGISLGFHEFDENVEDMSMCMCGIPADRHDEVMIKMFGRIE